MNEQLQQALAQVIEKSYRWRAIRCVFFKRRITRCYPSAANVENDRVWLCALQELPCYPL